MDIAQFSLSQFLVSTEDVAANPHPLPKGICVTPATVGSFKVLAQANGYRILDIGFGDVAAVDAAGNEAGYYNSNTLQVHDGHLRKGLAIALALWAHKQRSTLPAKRYLSAHGRKALTAAWEVASNKGRTSPWWP